ncbi:MAG: hypothetical protein ABIN17_02270 [candidate division WOR-3 bacterium]
MINKNTFKQPEIIDLSQKVKEAQEQLKRFSKLLENLSNLDQDRVFNFPKIKDTLSKILEELPKFEELLKFTEYIKNFKNWLENYQKELQAVEKEIQDRFGCELEEALKEQNLSLRGHYPELKTWLFTIELLFDKGYATIWYGPKQERLAQCSLSVSQVTKKIFELKKQLGSQVNEEEFLKKLYYAYQRKLIIKGDKNGTALPIIEILPEVAYLLQEPRFHKNPKKEYYKSYTRCDFSYDLFRILNSEKNKIFNCRLSLVVASLAHTKKREDFLWIPNDEKGNGTVYSHLKFEEVTQ